MEVRSCSVSASILAGLPVPRRHMILVTPLGVKTMMMKWVKLYDLRVTLSKVRGSCAYRRPHSLVQANLIQWQDKSRRKMVGPDAVDDHIVRKRLNVLSALHDAMLSPPLSPLN